MKNLQKFYFTLYSFLSFKSVESVETYMSHYFLTEQNNVSVRFQNGYRVDKYTQCLCLRFTVHLQQKHSEQTNLEVLSIEATDQTPCGSIDISTRTNRPYQILMQ